MGKGQKGTPTALQGGQPLRVWGIHDLVTSRLRGGAQGHGQDVLRAKALEFSPPPQLGQKPTEDYAPPPPGPLRTDASCGGSILGGGALGQGRPQPANDPALGRGAGAHGGSRDSSSRAPEVYV